MVVRWLPFLVALGCEGCIASALGIDRTYPAEPRSITGPSERPMVASGPVVPGGGCMTAEFGARCSAHPRVPQEWTSKRDRQLTGR